MKKLEQNKYNKIALDAIRTFGEKHQAEMLIEECAEVIMAVQKIKRAEQKELKYDLVARQENLIEEMADVTLVIQQFYLFDINIKKYLDKINKQYLFAVDKKNPRKTLVKECAKLIIATQEYIETGLITSIVNNMASVSINIDYLYSYNKKNKKIFDDFYKFKSERLEKRIAEYKKKKAINSNPPKAKVLKPQNKT